MIYYVLMISYPLGAVPGMVARLNRLVVSGYERDILLFLVHFFKAFEPTLLTKRGGINHLTC